MDRSHKTYGLTPQQQSAMLGVGNLLLTACPGSGKTTSISGRVAMLVENGRRVALLSHTNVGAKELANSVLRNHGIALSSDSYVGTLHSFVGKYLLRSFGHLVTGAITPVRMDPEEAGRYYPPNLKMAQFRFDIDGRIECRRRDKSASVGEMKAALDGRMASAKAGVVDYDDGLHWSLKILREYPSIAAALAARFDEIIVDEAQDSNETQIAILEALYFAGLKSLVLVGDFDQTIYGFSGSNPERCREASTRMGLTSKRLNENHRASQLLCNASARFRTLPDPDIAVGKYANLDVPPLLIRYDPGRESSLTARFSELISEYEVELGTSAVLVRNGDGRSAFTGVQGPKLPKEIGVMLDWMRGNSRLDSMRDLERQLISRAGLSQANLDPDLLRSVAYSAVSQLRPLAGDAHAWAQQAVATFDDAVQRLSPAKRRTDRADRVPMGLKGVPVASIGEFSAGEHPVKTIHGTKGESVDAIMIVAAEAQAHWHEPDADVWSAPLQQLGSRNISEELRVFYVALTRARQLAVLAVPTSTRAATVAAFQRAGFLLKQ